MTVFTQWMLNIKTMLPVSTHSHIYIEDSSHPRDVVLAVSFPHAGLWSYVTLYTFPFFFNYKLFQPPHSGLWTMYVAWDTVENQ